MFGANRNSGVDEAESSLGFSCKPSLEEQASAWQSGGQPVLCSRLASLPAVGLVGWKIAQTEARRLPTPLLPPCITPLLLLLI